MKLVHRLMLLAAVVLTVWTAATTSVLRTSSASSPFAQALTPTPDPQVRLEGASEPITAANASRVERKYAIGGGEHRLAWRISPDGLVYANIDDTHSPYSSDVTFYDRAGAVQSQIAGVHDFAISPDDQWAALTSEDRTVVVDLAGGAVQAVLGEGYMNTVLYSPDGSLVAADSGRSGSPQTSLWNLAAGAAQMTLGGSFLVGFGPDSSLVTCGADWTKVEAWRVHTDQAEAVLSQDYPDCSRFSLAFSPDGSLLAGWIGAQIIVWNLAAGSVQATLQQTGDIVYTYWDGGRTVPVAFSPDGTLLASVDSGAIHLWDVHSGVERAVLTGQNSGAGTVAFSPDGRFLAYSGDRSDVFVYVWNLQTGSLALKINTELEGLSLSQPAAVAFSPDSTLLAVASNHIPIAAQTSMPGIQLWDLNGAQPLVDLPMTFQTFQTADLLQFSRDGSLLVAAPDAEGKLQVFGLIASSVQRQGVTLTGQVPSSFSAVVPAGWLAVDPVPPRFEIQVENETVEANTCTYTGNNQLVHYQQVVAVTIIDLQTDKPLASRTFSGAASGACPDILQFYAGVTTQVQVNDASPQEFEAWVKETMAAYGLS